MLKGTLVCNNSLCLHSFQLNSTPLLYLLINVMLLEARDVEVQHGSCSSPRLIRPAQCLVRFLGIISQHPSVSKIKWLHVAIFINFKYFP
jgi:hypothetical protein